MTIDRDPPRLLELGSEVDPQLRALLQAGRDELPSATRLQVMAARLGDACAMPGLPPWTASPSLGSLLPALAGLTAVVVAMASALWWATPSGHGTDRREPARVPVASPPRPTEAEPASGQPGSAERSLPAELAAADAAVPARRSRARSADLVDPVDEFALLDAAQRMLASDPARALAQVESHRRRFPRGQYAQEREVIAIEALLGLQRFAAADRRARGFLERFPGSSHAVRVRQLRERARSVGEGAAR